MRRLLCLLVASAALAAGAAPAPASSGGPQPYRVRGADTREERTAVARTGAAVVEARAGDVLIRATPAERDAIRRKGFVLDAVTQGFPDADSDYHDYAELRAEVNAVAAAHPDIVHPFSIGASYEGRDLFGVRISDDATDDLSEPGALYVSLHHAREHMTVEVLLGMLHLFTAPPSAYAARVAEVVGSRQLYLVFALNPDGGEYDISGGTYKYWRKNRQPIPQSSEIGIDPNRNYAYRWACCGGSSGNPGSETYRGWEPWAAPEVAALRNFVVAHPNIRTAISYHSYGSLILYPYGYTYTDVPSDMAPLDHQTFVAMGRAMAQTTRYKPQQGSDLYITDGDFNDWMYGAHRSRSTGPIYPFTFELSGGTFYPRDEKIPSEIERNQAAAIYLAELADCPTRAAGVSCGGTTPDTWARAEDNAGTIAYSSGWRTRSSSRSSGGTISMAAAAGSDASFAFTGTDVRWIGRRSPAGGITDVYLDGVKVATVDTYAARNGHQQVLFEAAAASGPHTIRLVVTGAKNASSSGTRTFLDAFDVR